MTNAVLEITNSVAPINGLEVVKQVNDFYTSSFGYAFNHIFWLLTGMLTLLGIAVPAAYYFLQNRQLELKEKALEKTLNEYLKQEIANIDESLHKEIQKLLKAEREEMQQKFDKLKKNTNDNLARANAGIFHVQGLAAFNAGDHLEALKSFTRAIEFFLAGDLLEHVQLTMTNIKNNLPKLSKKDFSDPKIMSELHAALETTKKAQPHNLLNNDIKQLEKALAAAQAREP